MSATTYWKMTTFHLTVRGYSKITLRARVFSKPIFELLSNFLEGKRNNLRSTSVKVVPLTVTSKKNFRSPKNIAVSLHYDQKTGNRPISAHAQFYVFSVFAGTSTKCDHTTMILGENWSQRSPLPIRYSKVLDLSLVSLCKISENRCRFAPVYFFMFSKQKQKQCDNVRNAFENNPPVVTLLETWSWGLADVTKGLFRAHRPAKDIHGLQPPRVEHIHSPKFFIFMWYFWQRGQWGALSTC